MEGVIIVNGREFREVVPATANPVRIVVLQRGWVAVGRFSQQGDECQLTNAYVIRRWGTTKGLGQLAAEGPLPETILDAAGLLRFHPLTVVMTLDCGEAQWARHC